MKTASKRLLAAILAVMIVACATVFFVNASVGEPAFELSEVTGDPGDEVSVSLNVLSNPGITALSVQIAFSADDLELVSISNAGLFEDKISSSKITSNPITISWYASDSGDKTDSGELAVITFRIKEGAKSSTLTLSYDEDNVFDSNYDNVYFKTSNGCVKVSGSEPTEAPTEAPTDEPTFPPTEPVIKNKLIIGDADGDGEITILDATMIQRYLASYSTNTNIGEEIEY